MILEGDCLSLITKLRTKEALAVEIGLFIDKILVLCKDFDFVGFSFVRRGEIQSLIFLLTSNPMIRYLGFGWRMAQMACLIWPLMTMSLTSTSIIIALSFD